MEIDKEKQEKLNQHLAALPPKAAIALLREVQCDKLRGGNAYPHKMVIRQLIENLVRKGFKTDYLEQPWVLFCEPFLPFLVDVKNDPKQRGRISRYSVTVIWNWLMSELFHDKLPDLEIEIIHALKDGQTDQARMLMQQFHKQAGDRIWAELGSVEEGSKTHLGYNAKFGAPGVFEDALEVARALRIAPSLIRLHSRIQKGMTLRYDEEIHHCHNLYKQFLQTADDHVELGMLLISRQLAKPYEVLKIIRHHTSAELDTVILRDPSALSGTLILYGLEDSISEVIKLIERYEELPVVAEKITEFYNCIELFTSLIEISPKSLWGNRIIQIRNDLSSAIKQQIEQLPRLINILRYKKTQQGHAATQQDESGPNAFDVKQTIYIARLLQLSGRVLKQLSINDAYAKAKNESDKFIEAVAEFTVNELAREDSQEKKTVLKYFRPIVELTSILQGEELAAILERRGESACRAMPAVKTVPT